MKLQKSIGLLICTVLIGCSHGGGIVGKWKVDPDASKGADATSAGFLTGFSSTFWYEFKQDKTFVGAMSEGIYTLDGNSLAMTTTKIGGQDTHATSPQMTGTLSSDGATLKLQVPGLSSLKMLPASFHDGVPMVKDAGK